MASLVDRRLLHWVALVCQTRPPMFPEALLPSSGVADEEVLMTLHALHENVSITHSPQSPAASRSHGDVPNANRALFCVEDRGHRIFTRRQAYCVDRANSTLCPGGACIDRHRSVGCEEYKDSSNWNISGSGRDVRTHYSGHR